MEGEGPINKTTEALSAYANRFQATDPLALQSEAATFTLPPNITKVKARSLMGSENSSVVEEGDTDQDCIQAHVLTFKDNPYVYGDDQDNRVNICSRIGVKSETYCDMIR